MRTHRTHHYALAMGLTTAAVVTFIALKILFSFDSSAASRDAQWAKLSTQACENSRLAADLDEYVQEILSSVETLRLDAGRNVSSRAIRRSLLGSLAASQSSVLEFQDSVNDFHSFMGELCMLEGGMTSGPSGVCTLKDVSASFNDQVLRINAAQDAFSHTKRRINELQTQYVLHSESFEPLR